MKTHWSSWVLFTLLSPIYIPLLVFMWIGEGATQILYLFSDLENKVIELLSK